MKPHRRAALLPLLVLAHLAQLATTAPAAPAAPRPSVQDDFDEELRALLAEERVEADRLRRRGEVRDALRILSEHVDEEPSDTRARTLRALCWVEESDWERALADARRAFDECLAAGTPGEADHLAETARNLANVLTELGRDGEALAALESAGGAIRPETDARDALALGGALLEAGRREEAFDAFRAGAGTGDDQVWQALVAKARCQQRLGRLERASYTVQAADQKALAQGRDEPDVLVAYGDLFWEFYRELAEDTPAAGPKYREAWSLHPTHEGALVGLFELGRYNYYRQNKPAGEYLETLLSARPDSIRGLLAAAGADLDDGKLPSVELRLERLEELAGGRRDVRTLRAALHRVRHELEACERVLAELAAEDERDGAPERTIGEHLIALYRFAEALPFLQRATEREANDHRAWTSLGRALANTGDEKAAMEAFERAEREAAGRQDPWRHNLMMVLDRMATQHAEKTFGDLTFSWQPDAAAVLETYYVPFYRAAREELAQRYGYTPGPTRIEVFRRLIDFSVRSTGFEGFPALGVCFGPVVTAVSPLAPEIRGRFAWAETAFHEFSHVIHLGLSHNRCPRWITEGLATWEETNRHPAWTRNMRRDLLDARANGVVIPVRDLNSAFRTNQILFAYYQGGLLCQMLIERHGFPPMVRVLEAFDRGLDLDEALREVFGTTPELLDREFGEFVDAIVAPLAEEPRWLPSYVARLRLRLPSDPPARGEGHAERDEWVDGWCTIAWEALQSGRRVDAQEALRVLAAAGADPPRADFLRGTMALAADEVEQAAEHFERGLEKGGESFRARMALGSMARQAEDYERAEEHLLAAEQAFPGYDVESLSAELALASLYDLNGRTDDAMRARERWLGFNSGDYDRRIVVGRWHAKNERWTEAARYYAEANDIDPFRRALHRAWAGALVGAGRPQEALREVEVARLVPPELDADGQEPMGKTERAQLLGLEARALLDLGRADEAREAAHGALELDDDCEDALAVLERLES